MGTEVKKKKKARKVKLNVSEQEGNAPIILSFPGGIYPGAKDLSFSLFSSDSSTASGNQHKKRLKRRIVGENAWVAYEGNNIGEGTNCTRYLVGVYDKEDKTISFQDVGHIFVMRAIPRKANEKPVEKQDEGLTYMERKRLLIESFGSRKKQRAVEAAQANVVKAENVAGVGGLDGLVDKFASPQKTGAANQSGSMTSPSAAQAAVDESRRKLLPPFNMAAEKPSDVYNIEDIISKEMLTSVTNHLDASTFSGSTESFVKKLKTKLEFIPKSVLSDIQALPSLDDEAHVKRAKHLVMVRHMIALQQTRARGFKKSIQVHAKELKMPMSVLSQLFSRYTQSSEGQKGFQFPQQMKVKLQLHVMVACLILHQYQLDLSSLREDLKLKPEQISSFAREVGCVVDSRRKVSRPGEKSLMYRSATLKIPLQFPEPRKGGRK